MLDRLLKISSLSGALLIFCGVLKLIIYYSAFSIRIVEFLSFSEIITSFLDDINVLVIFCVAFFIQSVPTMNFLHKHSKSPLSLVVWFDLIMLQIYPHKIKLTLLFTALFSIAAILIYLDVFAWKYWVIYLMVFCLIQALTFLFMSKTSEQKVELPDASAALIVCAALVAAIILLAKHDIQTSRLNEYSGVVKTTNESYVYGKPAKNIYVGKTDNFLFLRSEERKSTICIPISELKLIEFK
jgi:hypothetical protein